MRHPYEKYIRLELITIILICLLGLFAIIQSYILFIFLGLYLLTVNLILTALIEFHTYRAHEAIKHVLRAIFLFVFTTYLIFLI
ncbi:hypothetical protein ACDX78_20170 [Virgibacillus oceani]